MFFQRIKYLLKMIWLFIRHSFVRKKPEFWSWCFELVREKKGNWFNDKSLVFFLLNAAIKFENDDQLCKLYSCFKSSFRKEEFFKKHIEKMQEACRNQNKAQTYILPKGSRRIDWRD